ncbi:hypothetical protein K0M31_004702, partial [Melipona bicolor]
MWETRRENGKRWRPEPADEADEARGRWRKLGTFGRFAWERGCRAGTRRARGEWRSRGRVCRNLNGCWGGIW